MEINRACPPRPTYRRQAGKLGEIIQIRINYFTCLRQAGGVYFYNISTVFPFDYFTKRPAAAGISIVFPN